MSTSRRETKTFPFRNTGCFSMYSSHSDMWDADLCSLHNRVIHAKILFIAHIFSVVFGGWQRSISEANMIQNGALTKGVPLDACRTYRAYTGQYFTCTPQTRPQTNARVEPGFAHSQCSVTNRTACSGFPLLVQDNTLSSDALQCRLSDQRDLRVLVPIPETGQSSITGQRTCRNLE